MCCCKRFKFEIDFYSWFLRVFVPINNLYFSEILLDINVLSTLFLNIEFYLINLLGLFVCILVLNSSIFMFFSDLKFLSLNKIISFCFKSQLLSLAGIPPLAGFFVKLYLFSLLSSDIFLLGYLVVFNFFSVFYYIGLIKFMSLSKTICIYMFFDNFYILTDKIYTYIYFFLTFSWGGFFFTDDFFLLNATHITYTV